MKPVIQTMLLREKEIEPTEMVLENVMGKDFFIVFEKLTKIFTDEFNMEYQWRFYNDGKAWLCKVTYKKKTILWLSIWENLIRTSFFFTEKTSEGVLKLEIDKKIKDFFLETKHSGKLIPLVIDITKESHFPDLKAIIKYKKELK